MQRKFRKPGKAEEIDSPQRLLLKNVIYHVLVLLRDLVQKIPDEKIGKVGGRARFWPPAV